MTDKTFWVLERDGRYVSLTTEQTPEGGYYRVPGWTDDIKDARHWPTQLHADHDRRSLGHPFWMADPVEHAWIEPEEYADGLAKEIGELKAQLTALQSSSSRDKAEIERAKPLMSAATNLSHCCNKSSSVRELDEARDGLLQSAHAFARAALAEGGGT